MGHTIARYYFKSFTYIIIFILTTTQSADEKTRVYKEVKCLAQDK